MTRKLDSLMEALVGKGWRKRIAGKTVMLATEEFGWGHFMFAEWLSRLLAEEVPEVTVISADVGSVLGEEGSEMIRLKQSALSILQGGRGGIKEKFEWAAEMQRLLRVELHASVRQLMWGMVLQEILPLKFLPGMVKRMIYPRLNGIDVAMDRLLGGAWEAYIQKRNPDVVVATHTLPVRLMPGLRERAIELVPDPGFVDALLIPMVSSGVLKAVSTEVQAQHLQKLFGFGKREVVWVGQLGRVLEVEAIRKKWRADKLRVALSTGGSGTHLSELKHLLEDLGKARKLWSRVEVQVFMGNHRDGVGKEVSVGKIRSLVGMMARRGVGVAVVGNAGGRSQEVARQKLAMQRWAHVEVCKSSEVGQILPCLGTAHLVWPSRSPNEELNLAIEQQAGVELVARDRLRGWRVEVGRSYLRKYGWKASETYNNGFEFLWTAFDRGLLQQSFLEALKRRELPFGQYGVLALLVLKLVAPEWVLTRGFGREFGRVYGSWVEIWRQKGIAGLERTE